MSIEMPPQSRNAHQYRWLEIGLIFVVFFVLGGAPAPHVNETYYLTKAKHYWEPSWCSGDPFLESADAHMVFYWTVGWLAKVFSLTSVAWIGRTVCWLLLAWSWHALSRRVFQANWLSVLSALLFVTLIDLTNFAGEWVIGGVEGKCFAYAFVFWALAGMVEENWSVVWPRLGLASAFHVLVGGWSTMAVGLVWLTSPGLSREKLAGQVPKLVLGGVLSLAGVLPALALTWGVSSETTSEASRIYVFDRIPHHLAPLHLPTQELLTKSIRYEIALGGFLFLWLLSLRIVNSGCQKDVQPQGLFRLFRFAAWSIVFSGIGFAWELLFWNEPLIAAKLLKYYFFRLGDISIPLATSLALCWLISELRPRQSIWCVVLLFASVSVPSWHLMHVSSGRLSDARPPADHRIQALLDWQEACRWARSNTPKDALFLVPRGSQSFTWHAERPDLVNWKDVPQDAESLLAWHQAYFGAFFYLDDTGKQQAYGSLAEQGTQRILQLSKTYYIDYVLTNEYPPLNLPVVYTNASFTIYAVEQKKLN